MKHWLYSLLLMAALLTATGCERRPDLHLYEGGDMELELPFVELALETYWNYELFFDVAYDWQAEWYYGWDDRDRETFGEIGYTQPSVFNLRRYYTGQVPYAHHTITPDRYQIRVPYFQDKYAWGFWDILVWNDIPDEVQSITLDESVTLDSIFAYTGQSMRTSRFNAPRYTHAFWEPEPLFSAYQQGIEINEDLTGFEYDYERKVWVKKLNMVLEPVTYIYLTQVILHHNRGRITDVDGAADLSGMSRVVNINTGVTGYDPITVTYHTLFKKDCDKNGESVDIAGGRLLTFGICGMNPNRVKTVADIHDPYPHYMGINMKFSNGMDSTFVFNVTDQVYRRFKGGVLTVELDMDTVPIPMRQGGSAFDAVVKDFEDGGTHEFEM